MAEKFTEAKGSNIPIIHKFGDVAPLSQQEKAELKMRIALAIGMQIA